jgi:hypothetical protein
MIRHHFVDPGRRGNLRSMLETVVCRPTEIPYACLFIKKNTGSLRSRQYFPDFPCS